MTSPAWEHVCVSPYERCTECGGLGHQTMWKLYVTPTTSTECLCETCVEKKLKQHGA